ncbi:ABC transporter permease [Geoalkalibacter halelectricus]|uniref:ABC transporter permease n=1 Tax=Geoalkalibacter halelectricus TaxID=2847045 RepID=A0ABY5ZQW0_9BACT|nr:ABC transporter permease [Geoalkalibacter halelectricus]MDO3377695.1 ABC transporter permease [Geoalkalibacter halelectricus]UWZ81483.1 ABC transporter permease [Geoalkalibacter halelectricus]
MIPAWHLSWRSLLNRRLTVALTVIAVSLSVALLLGVERLRSDARAGFAQTIAGTDLVVGARSGPVQLLLYTVFHIGNPTNNISWQSIEKIAAHPQVDWLVPISLGDSHRGFRVVGTSDAYFEHYRYGRNRALAFAQGGPFNEVFDAVIGAEVAARFGYELGEEIILSHGAGAGVSFAAHDDKPFTLVGVLARTGTPVDRSVLVSLEGIEAIHLGWQGGAPIPGLSIAPEQVHRFDLSPKSVTAALVGLKSRTAIFQVQRFVNTYRDEPLLAVLPGATLQELWGLIGVAEKALLAVSALVVLVGLAGLTAVIMASLGERRRELAILRSLGAGPRHIFMLLALEGLVLSLLGCLGGLALLYGGIALVGPWLEAHYGLLLSLGLPSPSEWRLLGAVVGAALLASLVPAVRAYRYSLADGMTLRI